MADIESMIGKVMGAVKDDPNILSELQSDPTATITKLVGESIDGDTMGSLLSGIVGKSGASGSEADGLMSSLLGEGGGDTLATLLGGITGQTTGTAGVTEAASSAEGATGNVLNDLTGGDGKVDMGDIFNVAEDLLGKK